LNPHALKHYFTFFILLVTTLYISYHSPGYDDEFYNVRLHNDIMADKTIKTLFKGAAEDPLHPSGSYLISLGLKELLGSWQNVRLLKTLVVISLIYVCILRLFPTLNSSNVNWVAVAVFSPSLILYGTGLRWGGEFTAFYLVLLSLDKLIPNSQKYFFFFVYTIINIVLFNLNYLALILAPLALIFHVQKLYLIKNDKNFPLFCFVFFIILNVSIILYFAHLILSINQTTQTGTLLNSGIGLIHGIFINWGLFPISYLGFAAFSSVLLLSLLTIINLNRDLFKSTIFLLIGLSILLIFVSGLGVKYRNVLPLLPLLFGFLIANTLSTLKTRRKLRPLAIAGLMLFVSTNIFGFVNVFYHRDTVKGSWNLPIKETLQYFSSKRKTCKTVSIYLWDPVLEFQLTRNNHVVYALNNKKQRRNKFDLGDCNFLLSTTTGSYSNHDFFKIQLNLSLPSKQIGFDKYYKIKNQLGADAPDYYVKIFSLRRNHIELISSYFTLSQF